MQTSMGNTCIPVVDSFWYLAKLIQLCKVKKIKLNIYIKKKENRENGIKYSIELTKDTQK